MVITGGDSLLSLLLLWSIFLPLGARYSIDKALNKETYSTPNHIFSVATLGIIVQIICVYIFNWFNKLDPVWTVSYTHLRAHETSLHLVCRLLLLSLIHI